MMILAHLPAYSWTWGEQLENRNTCTYADQSERFL